MISRRDLLVAGGLSAIGMPSFAASKKTFTDGHEYLTLPHSVSTRQNKIEVVKFFAYTCPHCISFEPVFNEWAAGLKDDVVVSVCPVAWQPKYLPFTQTYFRLRTLNLLDKLHMPFFESVVYQTYTYNYDNAFDDITAFMVDQGVDKQQWERTMRSFGVQNKARLATQTWQAYQIDSTPMFGVGGRFTTGPHLVGTRTDTPACLDHLIELTRQARR